MEDWIQVSRLPILWLVPSHSRKSCWERSLAPVEDDRISKSGIQPSTALERRGKTVWSTLIINNWYKTSINYFWQIVRCITSNFRKFSSFDPSNLPHNSMIIIRILFENVTIDTIRPSLKTIRFFPCFFSVGLVRPQSRSPPSVWCPGSRYASNRRVPQHLLKIVSAMGCHGENPRAELGDVYRPL